MLVNASTYNDWLENFEKIGEEAREEIRRITKRYPYMQSAWALLWLSSEQPKAKQYALHRAASLSSKHAILHALDLGINDSIDIDETSISSASYQQIQDVEEEVELAGVKPRENRVAHALTHVKQTFEIELQEVVPSPQIPIVERPSFELEGSVESTETSVQKSFADWMKLMVSGQTVDLVGGVSTNEQERRFALLDQFIESKPKIKAVSGEAESQVNYENKFELEDIVTETLAQLLFNQKKYGKAIKAYKALSLKYPEKSSFFANQIKNAKALKAKD